MLFGLSFRDFGKQITGTRANTLKSLFDLDFILNILLYPQSALSAMLSRFPHLWYAPGRGEPSTKALLQWRVSIMDSVPEYSRVLL